MARKNANYGFEDDTDLDKDGVTTGEEPGALTIEDIEKNSSASDELPDDEQPFDDLPNSPFKSDPAEDGVTRDKRDSNSDDEDEDEDDEDQDEAPELDEGVRADEDDEDTEDERMPKSWRKRLLRQERLLQEVREENRQIAERNRALERSQKSNETEQQFLTKKSDLETKIAAARRELADAHETGKSGDIVADLTEKLADLKGELRAETVLHEQRKTADKEAPPVPRQPRLAQQWMRKHQRFQTDAVFQAAAKAVDRQIAQEGFDPETDEYYRELDKRLKSRFPEEYKTVRNRGDGREDGKPQRRAPTQHMGRSEGSVRGQKQEEKDFIRKGNKVLISAKAKQTMRKFGLDPDNKEDVRHFIRENITR